MHKNPLRPLVVGGIGGTYFSVPVESETNIFELLGVAADVLLGGEGRMLASLYGILLRRQTKRIVSHGVKYVESFEELKARDNVGGDVP